MGKNTLFHLTESQLRKREKENASKIIDVYNAMALWVLRNEFGFGRARLDRFIEGMNKEAGMMSEHRYNFNDLRDAIKKETGIEV